MYCHLEPKNIDSLSPTHILPQTPFWAKVKSAQGCEPKAFSFKATNDLLFQSAQQPMYVHDDLLVLLKPVNRHHTVAYVPYGPKLEPAPDQQGIFMEQMSETLKPHLPSHCLFIRFDLPWQNQWATDESHFDENGQWLGPPALHAQEFRLNYQTEQWNLKKSQQDQLPKNTFIIDLQLGERELMRQMRYNTRRNIRVAQRKGVTVKAYDESHLPRWYGLFCETASRHGLPIPPESFFANVLRCQNNDMVDVKMLMAEADGHLLASMFLVINGKRATYLYGASSHDLPQYFASYALQWESMKLAKKLGCTEYDMFGSAPNMQRSHPLHGVHLYKKGFGGKLHHRMGCWDYPLERDVYETVKMLEVA